MCRGAAGRWRGQLVAIKVLRAAFPGDAAAELDSFRREVRVLSSLQHARIVGLLGVQQPCFPALLCSPCPHSGAECVSWCHTDGATICHRVSTET